MYQKNTMPSGKKSSGEKAALGVSERKLQPRESERRRLEIVENSKLLVRKKLDLALLILDRKKVAYPGNYDIAETAEEKSSLLKEFTVELAEIQRVAAGLGYPYQTDGVEVRDEAMIGFLVRISKDREILSRFIQAEQDGNDWEMGLMLGFPATAVATFNGRGALGAERFFKEELPAEEREHINKTGVLKFLGFQPSREHWREELEYVRANQKLIERVAPQLYQEIMASD